MSLTIDVLDCRYTVPPGVAQEATERLDRAAAMHLSSALANPPEPLPGDDGALCFIERMELDTTVDVQTDAHGLGRRWADALWTAISRRIRSGEGVAIFRTRSAWIAEFILDRLGGAETAFYHEELARGGGASADQVVSALVADGDAGRDALIEIHAAGRLDALLAFLGPAQIEAIVARCLLPPSPDVFSSETIRRWAAAIRAVARSLPFAVSGRDDADTLVLYLEVLRASPSLGPDVNLARFIARLVSVANDSCGAADHGGERRRGAGDTLGGAADRVIATLNHVLTPTSAAALIGSIVPTASAEQPFATEHAGVFFLACSDIRLDLDPLLRFLVLQQCLGGENSERTLADRGVAALAGLAAPPRLEWLAEQLGRCTVPDVDAPADPWRTLASPGAPLERFPAVDRFLSPISGRLVDAFARRLGAFSESTPAYLHRTFLAGRGVVSVAAKTISVRFTVCPMRVILRMAGFGGGPLAVPWLDATLELDLD